MRHLCVALFALLAPLVLAHALPAWDFTKGTDLGWKPNPTLGKLEFTPEGMRTSLIGTDPWLIGPAISVPAGDARYIHLRFRIAHHGGGGVYFTTDTEPQFKQENLIRFAVKPGGEWQDLWLDAAAQPAWKGTITGLRYDPIDVWPNIPAGQEIVVAKIELLPPGTVPAQLSLQAFHVGDTWLVGQGDTVPVHAVIANSGGRPAKLLRCTLRLPGFCDLTRNAPSPEAIPAGGQVALDWELRTTRPGGGVVSLDLAGEGDARLRGARSLFTRCSPVAGGRRELTLGNGRLIAERSPALGYGALRVAVRAGDGTWSPVATLPSLGTILTDGADDQLCGLELTGCPAPQPLPGGQGWLFTCTQQDAAGRQWSAELRLEPNAHGLPLFSTRLVVSCDQPALLRRLDAPTIIMDPVPSAQRQGGLFGGLEWLEGAEDSGSAADDTSPLRLRYRPHVNRIAVPLMVQSTRGGTAGWLWQPQGAPLGAVFGRPTREVTGRNDAVMGLFLPAITSLAGENDDFGMAARSLKPGEKLTLQADLLLARPEPDASVFCTDWLARFGLPQPPALPRGDHLGELRFTMAAFTDTLWVEAETGWQNGIGPARNVGRFGPFLGATLMGARWLQDATGTACADRLERTQGSPAGTRGGELPWYEGSLIATYGRMIGGYAQSLQAQQPDGGWDFGGWMKMRKQDGNKQLLQLGAADRSEVGFGAGAAASLLLLARVTGDDTARAAGLKALAWLDTFTVPRAAQCWEVPAHSPDIVAAADAIRACVEGFRLTGERRYLEAATRWAVRGLPFLYLWDDPKLPGMLYGSTPVFGASWFTGSWYGRPVQWCGLNYAEALNRLIEAGVTQPWTQVRDGLLSSGAHQQFTDRPRRALIPDSIDLTAEGLAADYWVAPYYLAFALAQSLGSLATPQTATVGRLRLSAMGQVTASGGPDRLTARLRFPEPGAHHVLVAGCERVGELSLNGAPLPSLPTVEALTGGNGWTLDAPRGLLEVRIAAGQEATLTLLGIAEKTVELLAR